MANSNFDIQLDKLIFSMKLFFLLNLTIGLGLIQIPINIFELIAKFIRYDKVGQNSYKFVWFCRQPIPSFEHNVKQNV